MGLLACLIGVFAVFCITLGYCIYIESKTLRKELGDLEKELHFLKNNVVSLDEYRKRREK